MKLDKKLCRQYANPGLKLDPDSGLLYAQQIKYIVRTEVKALGAGPVLILYLYSRERAAQGDCTPLWTIFQSQDDYITLERDENGKTKWRTASFQRLNPYYYFETLCAFYSAEDQRRVAGYFKDDEHAGFGPLTHAQNRHLEARRKERQLQKERKVLNRMECVLALPADLKTWAHRHVLPAYFFYNRARKGRATGVCSSCGGEVTLGNVKHNGKAVCPSCGREVTAKARGRFKRLHDHETGQVIQRVGPDELLVRIVKAHASYQGDVPGILVYENARQFIRCDPDGSIRGSSYYLSFSGGELTDWKAGFRPTYLCGYSFEADDRGHVYCGNLPEALAGTPWQYCPIVPYYEHFQRPMDMYSFLSAYLRHPRMEHLVKTGFYNLVSGLVYDYTQSKPKLDETQNRTHRVLGVMAEDVAFLRGLDVTPYTLGVFQKYSRENLKDRQKLLRWQIEHDVRNHVEDILKHMTVHRLIRYLEGQYPHLRERKTRYGGVRYDSMQAVVTEYNDYLEMCQKQKYDLTSSFILYPADLQKAHDKVAQRIQHNASAKLRRDFQAVYKRIMGQLDFEANGMKIVYPASSDEIVAEGNALHHCVGGYVDRVAAKKCMILFLRRCEDVDKPFFTVEVQHRKVVQVRGNCNAAPTPEVRKFMDVWERRVLRGCDIEMAA